jgi:hypothetical protein
MNGIVQIAIHNIEHTVNPALCNELEGYKKKEQD